MHCWYFDFAPFVEPGRFIDELYPADNEREQLEAILAFFYSEIISRVGLQALVLKLPSKATFA